MPVDLGSIFKPYPSSLVGSDVNVSLFPNLSSW